MFIFHFCCLDQDFLNISHSPTPLCQRFLLYPLLTSILNMHTNQTLTGKKTRLYKNKILKICDPVWSYMEL